MANKVVKVLSMYILSIVLLLPTLTFAKPAGLSIKLIHRDSPESPLYQPNLTQTERTRNLILLSKARTKRLSEDLQAKYNNSHPNVVRSKVDYQKDSTFLAQVSMGTFPRSTPISYFLDMDTGSGLIWIQCRDCTKQGHHCFPQRQPLFPDLQSLTYRKLVCNRHPLCFPGQCIQNFCSYDVEYNDGASTEGYLASETFTFESNSAPREVIRNMVFGCGFNQLGMDSYGSGGGQVAGIMGLGWSPRSLVKQLGPNAGGLFSHCLQTMPNDHHSPNTYLRFGADIPNRRRLQQTDLLQYGTWNQYFVILRDISIAGTRLRIPESYFAMRGSHGGTIIDSGTAYTFIVRRAYQILERALESYFSRIGGVFRIRKQRFFNLCYQRSASREGFRNLPTITFHLRNADLVVQPQGAFYLGDIFGREFFCLAMIPQDDETIIGAYQQTNQRFVYDLNRKILQFGPEDCTQNA